MGGKQHRLVAGRSHLDNFFEELSPRHRVEAGDRFIQHQQLRVMADGGQDSDLLLLPHR